MPLPELIEIVPLDRPVRAEITVPGSKSITNRALILAALADGEVTLTGALWSEDTQIMVECLRKLGFEIRVENDPEEFCNRTITVKGLGGKILPHGGTGTAEKPLELFVGNAGTAARFLSAFVCLGNGVYRLSGVARMHERPQAALFSALRELGYRVESENENDKLPVKIFGTADFFGKEARQHAPIKTCEISIEESSQFASALLLCAKTGGWKVKVIGENSEESPYVVMTLKLIEIFPKSRANFLIEPDASSESYFLAAGTRVFIYDENKKPIVSVPRISIRDYSKANWHHTNSNWQIDKKFGEWMHRFGFESICGGRFTAEFLEEKIGRDWRENSAAVEQQGWERIITSRQTDLGDSIMTAIILAPFAVLPATFTDLGRLRLQETERVVALRTELTKCGAKVVEEGDTLTVWPSPLHGAEIETYNDHRMAMCFAILGLKVPGIKIKNPACVKKTFPNFFQKLAAQPPHGLGVTILDAKSGRKLTHEELFAE